MTSKAASKRRNPNRSKSSGGRAGKRRDAGRARPKQAGTGAKRSARSASRAPLLRTSERSLWKTCRWSWDRCYNDRLKPIQEKPALRFGSLVHAALEKRYPPGIKRGPKPAETFENIFIADLAEVEQTWGFHADDEWTDALDLGVDMLENFVDTYGRDEDWKVIRSEMTFKVPVYSSPHPDGGFMNLKGEQIPKRVVLFYYVGTMDGVWQNRIDGGVRIIDWKTTGNDPVKEGQGKMVLDEQGTAYWTWGSDYLINEKLLKPREIKALDGMLYCFLRKAKRDTRPENAKGQKLNKPQKDGTQEVSKQQPLPYFHRELVYRSEASRENARVRATQEAIEMQQARLGIMPIYKTPDTGNMGHCNWCGYRDICELHEEGADWEDLRDSSMTNWDPYAAHEIREEGKRR